MFTVNDILALNGTEALAWYQSLGKDPPLSNRAFNWHGLAECGVTLAGNADDDDQSLAWATLVISVYDILAAMHPDGSFDISSMYCRVAMIGRHGPRDGHTILDPVTVFAWFRQHMPSDPDVFALLDRLESEKWKGIVVDVLRPLRGLKNRLNVIQALAHHVDVPDDIIRYIALKERLP